MFSFFEYFEVIACSIFFIGLFGIFSTRNSVIVVLMCIEMMLISLTFLFVVYSALLADVYGQLAALYIILVAGSESAIGLALVVVYHRLNGNIYLKTLSRLKNE